MADLISNGESGSSIRAKLNQWIGMLKGDTNVASDNPLRGGIATNPFMGGGAGNRIQDLYGSTNGVNCFVDSKIGRATGNSSMCSSNDGSAHGNRTVSGRRRYETLSNGIDTDSDVGTKPYVIVADTAGDITSFFPNLLANSTPATVTAKYGAGAKIDAKGNVYNSDLTIATYTGENVNVPNDLCWALHVFLVIKGVAEPHLDLFRILKATYTPGSGTKIYYDNAGEAFLGAIQAVYSSTSPVVKVDGIEAGNGGYTNGFKTSSWGYGANADGVLTRAWAAGAKAINYFTKALKNYSFAHNFMTIANGEASESGGNQTETHAPASRSTGLKTKVNAGADQGDVSGEECEVSGVNATAGGKQSHAKRLNVFVRSCGKFFTLGDNQYLDEPLKISTVGVGWHDFTLLVTEQGKSYAAETLLVGRQFSTTNGMAGESCAYKFRWSASRGTAKNFNPANVDVSANTIVVAEKITTNTKLILMSTGTMPGGLYDCGAANGQLYYAKYVDATHIQLSLTANGAAVDITSQGTGVHSYCRFSLEVTTKELIGRNFIDDGDTVGDGLTTGIRADLHTSFFGNVLGGAVKLMITGIATRSIRWHAITRYSEVM